MTNLLEKYKKVLDKIYNNEFVQSIIIFGSYSKGNIKPLSDLDITIIFKPNIKDKKKDSILAYATDELDLSDFYRLPLNLQYKILTTGKIYKSKINLRSLKIKTANKWFDFKPTLNRIYKSKGLIEIY